MNTPQAPTGLLVIDKPLGRSSMDVCRAVRRRLVAGGAPKRVKVGHGGTLDPLATGVLVVLVGKATRLCDRVMSGDKRYVAEVDLSAFTTTDDREGERTEVNVSSPPTREALDRACAEFVGTVMQRPPVYSAIKIDGRRAYDLARRGRADDLVIPARPVRIDRVSVEEYRWPLARLVIDCGKGVYIRSLARDLGALLGTGGTLASLRRTRVGDWSIEEARTIESLPETLTQYELIPIPAPLVPDQPPTM
ncbi:MAG: tRNA pseudouridine(55) synthase TruB [Phycisphaeraceae bacterium]|nr:tRNA pseudouridine(55) synthase TruB [Phycisphaeraceae bacterium]